MNAPAVCPDAAALRAYARGESAEADADALDRHLASCRRCLAVVAALDPDDHVVAALRQAGVARLPRNPLVGQLRPRLYALRREAASLTRTDAGAVSGVTADGPVPAGAADPVDFLAPPQGPGEIGRLGGYRVLRALGAGGMGVVLEAEDTQLKRRVALKVMRPQLAASPSARQRFLREAQLMARVTHDHIVTVHQVGEDRGVPFLAMPLLQGETLEDRLRREKTLPLADLLRIGREAALALMAAHQAGLIHRDVKPANLWLEAPTGRVKVLDFGLARASDDEHLTQTGAAVGTPAYMAPEQLGGDVDPRSDLFSLGCVLYRAATGRLPFGGSLLEVLGKALLEAPPPAHEVNPEVPQALGELIARLMSKNKADRPASAGAVLRELAALMFPPTLGPGLPSSLPGPLTAAPAAPVAQPVGVRVATPAPVAVPVAAAVTPQAPAAQTVAVTATPPQSTPAVPRTERPRRLLWVLAGMAAVLAVGGVLLAFRGGKPDDGRGQQGDGGAVPGDKGPRSGIEPPRVEVGSRKTEAPPFTGEVYNPAAMVSRPGRIDGLKSWNIESDRQTELSSIGFTPDGRHLVLTKPSPSGVSTYTRWWWDVGAGGLATVPLEGYDDLTEDGRTAIRGWELWRPGAAARYRALRGAVGAFRSACFAPGGKLVATTTNENELALWLVEGGDRVKLPGMAGASDIAWSPDGLLLSSFNSVNSVIVYDAGTGKPFKVLNQGEGMGYFRGSPRFTPDGQGLLTWNEGNVLHLWGLKTGLMRVAFREAANYATATAWSPDGKYLAYGGTDTTVRVALADTGEEKLKLAGHTGPVLGVAWSPNGRTVVSVSGGTDRTVRFWDVETGELRGLLLFYGGEWVALSPDGHYRASRRGAGYLTFVTKPTTGNPPVEELEPAKFAEKYKGKWQNDEGKVRLLP
jgi:WD40 repeat protein/tRNA A-37 threonylcarbamoyl transferase component Bud32